MVLVLLIVAAPPATAHDGYNASGFATDGDTVLQVSILRAFDITGLFFNVILLDPVTGDTVLFKRFSGADNWCNDEVCPEPYANPDYEATSADPTVCFHLDGTQALGTVTGRGHFNEWDLVITAPVL